MAYLGKLPTRNLAPKGKPPCENCSDRFVGCHATCKKYTEWKDGWVKMRIEQHKAHNAEKAANDFLIKTAVRVMRRQGEK